MERSTTFVQTVQLPESHVSLEIGHCPEVDFNPSAGVLRFTFVSAEVLEQAGWESTMTLLRMTQRSAPWVQISIEGPVILITGDIKFAIEEIGRLRREDLFSSHLEAPSRELMDRFSREGEVKETLRTTNKPFTKVDCGIRTEADGEKSVFFCFREFDPEQRQIFCAQLEVLCSLPVPLIVSSKVVNHYDVSIGTRKADMFVGWLIQQDWIPEGPRESWWRELPASLAGNIRDARSADGVAEARGGAGAAASVTGPGAHGIHAHREGHNSGAGGAPPTGQGPPDPRV